MLQKLSEEQLSAVGTPYPVAIDSQGYLSEVHMCDQSFQHRVVFREGGHTKSTISTLIADGVCRLQHQSGKWNSPCLVPCGSPEES